MNAIRYSRQLISDSSNNEQLNGNRNIQYFPGLNNAENAIKPVVSQEEIEATHTDDQPISDRLSATNLEAHNHIYEETRANKQSVEARKFLFENPDNFSPDKIHNHFNVFVSMSKKRLNRIDLLRNIHRRNLYYLKVTFPDDEIEVDKENYAFLLMGYRFFNKEKFNVLTQMITFGEILDSMNSPTSSTSLNVDKAASCSISRILRAHYALAREQLIEYIETKSIANPAEILRLYDECTRF